jgi:hypothetical protein
MFYAGMPYLTTDTVLLIISTFRILNRYPVGWRRTPVLPALARRPTLAVEAVLLSRGETALHCVTCQAWSLAKQ